MIFTNIVKSFEADVAHISLAHTSDDVSSDTPKGRVIDLVYLARQTLGDPGLEQEVLRIFSSAIQSYGAGVRDSQSESELKINLHSLKGASGGVGALGLAAVARSAEAELRETGDVCAEARADIGFSIEEANTYIQSLLKD